MSKKQSILIVEDDKHISKLIRYNLEKEGYNCVSVITGEDALDVLMGESMDLVILDIMFPKMDGFETCKHIRQDKSISHVPIIMLTARGEEYKKCIIMKDGKQVDLKDFFESFSGPLLTIEYLVSDGYYFLKMNKTGECGLSLGLRYEEGKSVKNLDRLSLNPSDPLLYGHKSVFSVLD